MFNGGCGFSERPKRPDKAKGQVARKRKGPKRLKGQRNPRMNGMAGPKGLIRLKGRW